MRNPLIENEQFAPSRASIIGIGCISFYPAASCRSMRSLALPLERMTAMKRQTSLIAAFALTGLANLAFALPAAPQPPFDEAHDTPPVNELVMPIADDGFDRTPLGKTIADDGFDRTPLGQAIADDGFDRTPLGKTIADDGFDRTPLGKTIADDGFDRTPLGKMIADDGFDRTPLGQTIG
jgi:hypothetical protein